MGIKEIEQLRSGQRTSTRLQKDSNLGSIDRKRVANSMVEYSAFNRSVPGSSPGQPIAKIKILLCELKK